MNPKTQKAIFFLLLIFTLQPVLSAQQDTLQADALIDQAFDLYDEGAYIAARRPFQKALELRLKFYSGDDAKIEELYLWMGDNEQGLRDGEKAIEYYNKGLNIALKRAGVQSISVADFYMELGNVYDQLYRVEEAKEYYQKTLEIYKKEFGPESSEVGNVLMNIGYGQRKMGNYRDAGKYYDQAFELFQKSSDPNSKDFYRIYINQCNLLIDLGNYDRALEFAHKALTIKLMHYDTLHPSVYKYYGNIGRIYQLKGMPQEALPYAQKALDIAEKTRGKNHPETAGQLGFMASLYTDLGQMDKALKLQKKSVKIQEKGLPPTHPYLVAGYEDIGNIYEAKKEYDNALDFYQYTIQQYQKATYVPQHLIAGTLLQIAKVNFKKGSIENALSTIQQGLLQIASDFVFEEKNWYQNPSLDQVQAEVEFLNLLRYKAVFLHARFEKSQQQMDLEQALITSELAIQLLEKIRRSYQSDAAKEFLNTDMAPIYEQAVQQAFKLYQLTKNPQYLFKAFDLSEKSKASILWQSIHHQNALEASNIPPAELDTLQSLSRSIAILEESLWEQKTAEKRKAIRGKIFDLKINYEQAIDRLEKYNPQYFQLKYASNDIDLSQLIQHIPNPQTALVSYFHTSEQCYIFVLTKNGLQAYEQKLDFDLAAKIIALRNNEVQSSTYNSVASDAYIRTLGDLYQLLLQPIDLEIQNRPNLIIIPHGILQYLSFEALAPAAAGTDFRKLDYLLNSHSIQYAWSAALWLEHIENTGSSSTQFAGFAPDFGGGNTTAANRDDLLPLSFSEPEVRGAHQYFPGKIFLATAATESQFLETAPQSNILHLATHAIANDRFPMQSGLFFSEKGDSSRDGFLNTLEIYNLHLSADLAVMSACNTGYGQLVKGEGVMSLGRAFLYAGCKSVVMSLWLANDQSVSSIVQDFYKYSAQGMAKNEALRQAKLEYLRQADALTAHPHFWANLVAVGDMNPLKQKSKWPNSWLFFSLLSAAVLAFGCWLKSKYQR